MLKIECRIKDSAPCLIIHTRGSVQDRIDNLAATLKGFPSTSPVGQMLRGELDFWKHQKQKAQL